MPARSQRIAALLFFSGACALIYQVVWLRGLRLVFGASTPATAAVLAVFMGGLGYGSLVLGKRADKVKRPLAFYGNLELCIALAAAVSTLLLGEVRDIYIALGGSVSLGWLFGTVVRLLLAALVLLPPTLAMGGTLPAAARAAIPEGDEGRRSTALLYGINTLGAVLGLLLATFVLLEALGTQRTLWVGCVANLLVGVAAHGLDWSMKRQDAAAKKAAEAGEADAGDEAEAVQRRSKAMAATMKSAAEDVHADVEHPLVATMTSPEGAEAAAEADGPKPPRSIKIEQAAPRGTSGGASLSKTLTSEVAERVDDEEPDQATAQPASSHARFVLIAAAASGFAFLLMELVWYRVLSPLLGGSTYTFGLVLAVALAGIGIGGLLYSLRGRGRPALLSAFAVTCALEALFIAIPYALGDRVALFALTLRGMGSSGLAGHAVAWSLVTAVVVLPAAVVAGYQFPLLIALLGKDKQSIARHVGLAYAFNTLGAIVGSLAGGFLMIPVVTALGAWRVTVWTLLLLGAAALWRDQRQRLDAPAMVAPAIAMVLSLLAIYGSVGPTAVWRHSPIGAGRAESYVRESTRNAIKERMHERRRSISWQVDGRESTVGLYTLNDTSFLVNGKSDGAAVVDGGTQVMGGMVGALLQPGSVKRALVIGLGTGSTAGWLAQLPEIERVDVVELEPAIRHVARVCAPVNRNVLDNPKANIIIGDAREVLLTSRDKYDLIFSEPSNPYRAGIASLFTQEFYAAVRSRLAEGGVFIQWVQAYEIDASSVRTVYATLGSAFPSIESWRTKYSDLVLVSRMQDVPLDVERLRQRIDQTPFKEALLKAWRVTTVEGVLAHFVAQPGLARAIAEHEGTASLNTDDRNLLEFSIARALGRPQDFSVEELQQLASLRGEALPEFTDGGREQVSVERIFDAMVSMRLAEGSRPVSPTHIKSTDAMDHRARAHKAWDRDEHREVISAWNAQTRPPETPIELMILADAQAVHGNDKAVPLIAQLAETMPIEADAITAKLRWAQGKPRKAWEALSRALIAYRTDPWSNNHLMSTAMPIALDIAKRESELMPDVKQLLEVELAVHSLHYLRVDMRLNLGLHAEDAETCLDALREFGPHIPWDKHFLERRVKCYELAKHAHLDAAHADLDAFIADEGAVFADGLQPEDPASPISPKPMKPSGEPEASPSAAPSASSKTSAPAAPSSSAASGG